METRYYFIYGPVTLNGVTSRIFVGYLRITETNGFKNASMIKATIRQIGNHAWQYEWNIPELCYQYPLIYTFDNVVHDAIQLAYVNEHPESYVTEYFPYL